MLASAAATTTKKFARVFLQQAVLLEGGGQEGEVKGGKLDSIAVVELVLELHPKIRYRSIKLNQSFLVLTCLNLPNKLSVI